MQKNDLVAAKLCYKEALGYLDPKFKSLTTVPLGKHLFDKMDQLKKEIAMIFGNQSLVMLKTGDIKLAVNNAEQSLAYFPTAKVHTTYITIYNMYKIKII